jgi:hypothetical protein
VVRGKMEYALQDRDDAEHFVFLVVPFRVTEMAAKIASGQSDEDGGQASIWPFALDRVEDFADLQLEPIMLFAFADLVLTEHGVFLFFGLV